MDYFPLLRFCIFFTVTLTSKSRAIELSLNFKNWTNKGIDALRPSFRKKCKIKSRKLHIFILLCEMQGKTRDSEADRWLPRFTESKEATDSKGHVIICWDDRNIWLMTVLGWQIYTYEKTIRLKSDVLERQSAIVHWRGFGSVLSHAQNLSSVGSLILFLGLFLIRWKVCPQNNKVHNY